MKNILNYNIIHFFLNIKLKIIEKSKNQKILTIKFNKLIKFIYF